MALHWTDVEEIAILLAEHHPDADPTRVNFVDLRAMVLELPGFTGDPERCNEKILEAIQMHWIEESR